MEITLIAAMAKNRVIGNNGNIPWLKNDDIRKPDLQRFRRLTLYRPVIMGRATFDSLGKIPLKDRYNIVVSSRNEVSQYSGVIYHALNIEDALDIASKLGSLAYVIGGQRIYEQTIGIAKKLEITEVKGNYEGDAFFPYINHEEWNVINKENKEKCSFVTYERKGRFSFQNDSLRNL